MPQGAALAPEVKLREVWAWSMYDFANSGYTTVVITAVYNAFFVAAIAGGAPWATFAWTAALSLSYLAVLLSAPLIGAWADAHAAKKRLLGVATAGCVLFTAALWLPGPGAVALAIAFIVLSNFFFATGENLIAAFLPELADAKAMGRVSGWGWAFGYLGGLFSLGLSLVYITWAQGAGQSAAQFVPATMLITAALFALCAMPTFLFLRERALPQPRDGRAWARVLDTLRHARQFRDLRRFLACILFYQAGIMAVIALAAIYAQEAMKFTQQQTIVLVLVVNITAALGAFGFGYLQDAIGHVRAMALILVGWIVMIALAYLAEVLGRRQPRRPVHGLVAGGRPRDRGLPLAARTRGRVLRPVGAGGQGRLDLRAAHLRRRHLDLPRRPPPRHPRRRRLLRRRPRAARGARHGARAPRGARGGLKDYSSTASMVIFALSRREIGHPALALFAAFSNAALSAPGTLAFTDRWLAVTVMPASVFSSVTVAVVAILSALRFAWPSWPESAIEKQAACAAAISSSGSVLPPDSKRLAKV
jgi:UMF1 family MFS transporter